MRGGGRDDRGRQGRPADCPAWQQSPEDGRGGRRQGRGKSLPRDQSLQGPYPRQGQAGNRAHPPDPRTHESYQLSAGGRPDLRRPAAHPAGCQPGVDRHAAGVPAPGIACQASGAGTSGRQSADALGSAAARGYAGVAGAVAPGRRDRRMKQHWLQADWPAPEWVRTCVTTRQDGCSQGVFKGFNLGTHVGDELNNVLANRAELGRMLGCRMAWLEQTHSTDVVEAAPGLVEEADASWTLEPDVACVIMTADCLPVLFCDRAGTRVAATHAGWRGLAAGILENTISALGVP